MAHMWIPNAGKSAGKLIVTVGKHSVGFAGQKGIKGLIGKGVQRVAASNLSLPPGVGQAVSVAMVLWTAWDIYQLVSAE